MIQLLLSDVDGVMTDGGVTLTRGGGEQMTFSIRDGLGIKLWQHAGGQFGIVTGRQTEMVGQRAEALGVEVVHQGVADKLPVVEQIAAERGVPLEHIAYLGDDLPDLPAIRAVGLGVAVADAAAEVQTGADLVLQTPGGRGAVRELVETLLKESGKWDALLAGL
ncbi:MAG: HAD hydrolase family protein [Planctomycetota bacterium]